MGTTASFLSNPTFFSFQNVSPPQIIIIISNNLKEMKIIQGNMLVIQESLSLGNLMEASKSYSFYNIES